MNKHHVGDMCKVFGNEHTCIVLEATNYDNLARAVVLLYIHVDVTPDYCSTCDEGGGGEGALAR